MNRSHVRKLWLLAVGTLAGAIAGAQTQNSAPVTGITRIYVVTVPPAQDRAFRDGMKHWASCLRDHGAKHMAQVYDAVTGDLSRYALLIPHRSWAGMDRPSAASKACATVVRDEVIPHFSHAFSEIEQIDPKLSYMPGGDQDPPKMVWVAAYRFKPGQQRAFMHATEKFAAAAAKIHWQAHFFGSEIIGAGEGGEEFLMVWPQTSWANVGQDAKPSAKQMMDSVYGAAAARANHEKVLGSIAESWSDIWRFDKKLSYLPARGR
ncbi:MAG TPA: hypothetical protein VMU86_04455 [Steroidobacteraceae bacterium]|nr:hypothetical protein [Steroidobacteraceae bacterium]